MAILSIVEAFWIGIIELVGVAIVTTLFAAYILPLKVEEPIRFIEP